MFPDSIWEKVRALAAGDLIAELRGWRAELVGPRHSFMPTASELSSPCPTKRDVYLSRVLRAKPPDDRAMKAGAQLHSAFLEPFRVVLRRGRVVESLAHAKAKLLRGLSSELRARAAECFDLGASLASAWLYSGRRLPLAVEPELPGSPIGLSGVVKPDLVVGVIPLDFVLGDGERKDVGVAAYAMALEASTFTPVNFGIVVSFQWSGSVSWRVVIVDDELRRRALELRDDLAGIVERGEDPGRAERCPQLCAWRGVCFEGLVRV
ncbi:MAG: type I-A CRISPR-associated protein Cas4/Csa1 [Thermofilum sp.]